MPSIIANKTFYELERIVRGFSNHRRIEMIYLLEAQPDISLARIAEALRINFKTASEHLRRLAIAGLIAKRTHGRQVRHTLTELGCAVLTFLRTLE